MRLSSTSLLGRRRLTLAVAVFTSAAARAQSPPELSLVARIDAAGVISVVRSSAGYIYYSTGTELRGFHPAGGGSFRVDSGAVADLAMSPQGDRLAFSRGETSMSIWTIRLDPKTGKPIGRARRLSVSKGRGAAFSPDGRFVAFSVIPPSDTVAPRIVRVPVGGGPELVVAREPGWAQSLRWSADGKWIYYRHGARTAGGNIRTLRRVDADGGTPTVLVPIGDLVGVSPDGRSLAYLAPETPLRAPRKTVIISNERGEELRRFALPRDVTPLDWGSDGTRLLALRSSARTGIRFVEPTGQVKDLTPTTGSDDWPALSPDGRQLAVRTRGDDRDHLTVVDLQNRARRVLETVNEPGVGHVLWSPNGAELAFLTDDGRALFTIELATGKERRVGACAARISGIMWNQRPGLRYLCPTEAAVELRAASLNGESAVVAAIPVRSRARVEVVPAGDSAIILLSDNQIVRVQLPTGARRTVYTALQGESLGGVAVSPDRGWIAFLASQPARANGEAQDVVRLVPIAPGTTRALPVPPIRMIGGLSWDPERRHIAVLAEQEGPRLDAWLLPLDGSPAYALTALDPIGIAGGASFARDGSGVVYTAAGRTEHSLWSIEPSRRPRRTPPVP